MRKGRNPFWFSNTVSQPKEVTVATCVHIPFLSGYYAQSLDILKLCLGSICRNTDHPYDLMVFDNGSCPEVIDYLMQLRAEGRIQYLLLSEKNIGYMGAWNFLFSAAPGEFVAYCDSDVFFHPNWLSEHMRLFKAFPNVGTVQGFPRRRTPTYCERTVQIAEADPNITVERGRFIPQEWMDGFLTSLGKDPVQYREKVKDILDVRLRCNGVEAFANAGHFQFVAPKRVLTQLLPFPTLRALDTSHLDNFDQALDDAGYLRLATIQKLTEHLGNTLTPKWQRIAQEYDFYVASKVHQVERRKQKQQQGFWKRILRTQPVQAAIRRVYDRLFWLAHCE